MEIKPAELHKLILDRRTVHNYLPGGVAPEIIERAIECGVHAQNHRLTYPWRFFWVGPEARARIAVLHDEFKKKKFVSQGGELLVVALVRAAKPEVADEDYASLGCALQNMALYLWSEGFGTKWSTSGVSMSPGVFEILNPISAEALRLCGFFWVGRPEVVPDRPERPPLDKFLFKLR